MKQNRDRVRICLQKKGRLTEKSIKLLEKCGLTFSDSKNRLISKSSNFPVDLMFVRDDDIPEYLADGTCDLGIVGEDVVKEKSLRIQKVQNIKTIRKMNFSKFRLGLAVPTASNYDNSLAWFNGKTIATSYPLTLNEFFKENNIESNIIEITGAVELSPILGTSDAICDIISTGATLKSNGLKEVDRVLTGQAVLAQTGNVISDELQLIISKLLKRMDGVKRAENNKYIMLNAPKESVEKIRQILPGMEKPSIMPLENEPSKVAVHAVCQEEIFWETMERLEEVGASSILVLPIEKII